MVQAPPYNVNSATLPGSIGKLQMGPFWAGVDIWGSYRSKDDDSTSESGRRLYMSTAFVKEFLRKMNMDLVMEVEIKRDSHRSRYDSYKDDGLGYLPPYARIYIMKANGETHAL